MAEYRDPPIVNPRPYGLFSVAQPEQKGDGAWQTGAEWQPEACSVTLNYADALCAAPSGTNEVQTVSITGTPTGGTYTLSMYAETTAPITYNTNAAGVQTKLLELSAFDTGDVVVTGTYPNFTLTFGGRYAAQNVAQVTATSALTGGTTPNVTTATTTPGVRTAKTLSSYGSTTTANPFTIYTMQQCRTVGEMATAQERAMRVLTLNEEAAVEKEVWTRIAAGATNITGTLASPETSLALLEEAIGDAYAGRPVIHVSPNLGSILATKGAIEKVGNHMETKIGSYVVIGRGYPRTGPGGAPAAGSEFMQATGSLVIERSTAFVKGPMIVQSPLDNTQVVLAERVYVAGYDCTAQAIRVTFP